MIRLSRLVASGSGAALFLLLLVGCREQTISYYEVPREQSAPADGHEGHAHGPAFSANSGGPAADSRMAAAARPAGGPQLEWSKPAAWTEKPASSMRLGSYAAPGGVDISVTAFPDAAGGLLANVNRWRGQVGLAPVAEAELEQTAAKRTEIVGQVAWLVDFAGTAAGNAPAMGATPAPSGPTRIMGAIVPLSGMSWFFKMIGPDEAVSAQRGAFDEFVASIRAVSPASAEDGAAAAAAPSPTAPAATPGSGDPHAGLNLPNSGGAASDPHAGVDMRAAAERMGMSVSAPSREGGFTFAQPEKWQAQQGASSMRLLSFVVPGEGVPAADVSVMALAGPAGGDLANVNRWRQQIGLAPVDAAQLASLETKVEGQGVTFRVFDLEGTERMPPDGHRRRTLAAILPRGGATWFYKMTGEADHVARQRDDFIQFLRSFRFDPTP